MKTSLKQIFAMLLVCTALLSLCACGEPAKEENATPQNTQAQLSADPALPFKDTVAATTGATEPPVQTTPEETTPELTIPETTTVIPETTLPEVTAPGGMTQPIATQPASGPAASQPGQTQPDATQPAATQPTSTQPPVTQPEVQIPEKNPYVNEAGQTVFYYGGGNLVFGWDENGEPYSYVVQPEVYVYDVTPLTLTVADWNSWSTGKQIAFRACFYKDLDDPKANHNYLWVTQFDGYDCGYEGHACRNEQYHNQLMKDLATPCYYCGETNCPSYLALDPETLFTKEDSEACPEYDKTRDPFFYCQKCHKTKWGRPSESCNQYLADVNCYTCGQPVKAHACHTCAFDEDIYDEYEEEFTAPPPATPPVTTPEPTTPPPTTPAPTTTVHVHDYGVGIYPASCTKQGYTRYFCSCGDEYKTDYVDAYGHNYSSWVVEPTTSSQGYTEYTCLCGYSYQDNFTPMLPTEP